MKIKLYGRLAEIAGADTIEIQSAENSEKLLQAVFSILPALKYEPFFLSVNRKVVTVPEPLQQGSELALLPPFAGG